MLVILESKGAVSDSDEGYLRKYHELSRKVSETSVSLLAVAPHSGQPMMYHSSILANGLTPESSGLKSSILGRTIGKSFSGTGTGPHSSQWIIGMGGPQ